MVVSQMVADSPMVAEGLRTQAEILISQDEVIKYSS
jgi:hypothetical protein